MNAVLSSVLGLDPAALTAQAASTLADLRGVAGAAPALASALGGALDGVDAALAGVDSAVSALEAAISYSRFHPVYLALKGWAFCTLLDSLGSLWAALLGGGSCGLALLGVMFAWIARADRLPPRGCCHAYSPRDFSLEGAHDRTSSSGDGVAVLTTTAAPAAVAAKHRPLGSPAAPSLLLK